MTVAGIVVVGASAGGVEALRALVGGLPTDLPAPVVVVLHIARHAPSALPAILDRAGPLPAVAATHGARLEAGVVYVAPADVHVLVVDEHLHLSRGPSENGHRPAIDPLFRSAAAGFGPRAVGVVLSGTRDDGAAGLAAVAEAGGGALVQEPEEALYPGMPRSALEHVRSASSHPADKLGAVLAELLRVAADRSVAPVLDERLLAETRISAMTVAPDETVALSGATSSGLSCPSCEGVLFELPGEPAPRFRCRVGHAWSPESLTAEQTSGAEHALWVALRAIEEKRALLLRLAESAERSGRHGSASRHRDRAAEAERNAASVRALIVDGVVSGPTADHADPAQSG
ncbi:chemotaxis protein CheB [Pseudonocardia humida]|uniref:protein-glutamate methylesterase n=1 Tax=Pseudonocardia humida TaxID=2800819 RepID=A0ABT1A1X5_9PSEU|nr:chemotaxis protein CheB [Pseudonocardia humida]MCO1657010.1 chemotaxis protein CheB [Pseudonocardia humida]